MYKVAYYRGVDAAGIRTIPLFGKADGYFEKVASSLLLTPVVRYIETLRPRDNTQYVLTNAMGASEYFGSNINGDWFPEEALIHAPDDWTGNPLVDKIKAKDWPYGYPTFYGAHPFAHHRNKDADRAFGEVELAVWNDRMKRVELVIRVDKDKCEAFGGVSVWDRLKQGNYCDVSMGCRVPWDLCSCCADLPLYHKALATFDPKIHKHPGIAVLQYHKRLLADKGTGIRGLAVTRNEYCDHAKNQMNKILPDGRKVYVINYFPRFFDISFVFVGADKTAKVMMKIAEDRSLWHLPGEIVDDRLGYGKISNQQVQVPVELTKQASIKDEILKLGFLGKRARAKRAEIEKSVRSQLTSDAIPILTKSEPDIPNETLDQLCKNPLENILATSAGMGIVLKPREFQRIILTKIDKRNLADEFDSENILFPRVEESERMDMGPRFISNIISRILTPFLTSRSALAPHIESRMMGRVEPPRGKITIIRMKISRDPSHDVDLLNKIGSAYKGYREQVLDLLPYAQSLAQISQGEGMHKIAACQVDHLFSDTSVCYVNQAYWDDLPRLNDEFSNRI